MKRQQRPCWRHPTRSTTTTNALGVCHGDGLCFESAPAETTRRTARRRGTTGPPASASAAAFFVVEVLMLLIITAAALPVAEAFKVLSSRSCAHRRCCPPLQFLVPTTPLVSRHRRPVNVPPPRTAAFRAARTDDAGCAPTKDDESAQEEEEEVTMTSRPKEEVVALSSHLDFTDEELAQIKALLTSDDDDKDDADLQTKVKDALPNLSPSLLMKLQRYLLDGSARTDMVDDIQRVARAIQSAVEQRRSQGANLLQQLLGAGEIRKLDSLIGKAGRSGQLDPAFFQVLQLNLRDAAAAQQQPQQREPNDADAASRYQILSHIYTRCQEEVEKALPPGIALLNKLLRTPEPSIRSNLISHYLTQPPQTITSPDGKTITLTNVNSSPLVSMDELIGAVTTLVSQVRMVEAQQSHAGGAASSSASVAIMVESVRQLCKEVLGIVMESYGPQSSQVAQLKDGLQPVFRPEETRNDDGSTPSAIPTATETTATAPPSQR